MSFYERTIEEKSIYEGKIIKVRQEIVELPDGREAEREIVRHPGGVAILAYKDENTVLLVEQFRKPFNKNFIELPAGKLEPNEPIEACGRRELEEETGYKARKFTYLGKVVSSPGFCDESIHLYKAEDLYKGKIGGDEDEFIHLHEIHRDKVKEMIKNGEIIDAKTICAFMLE